MKQKTIFIVFLVTLLQINDCNPNASQKEETDPITSLLVSSLLTSGLRTSTTTTTGSATTTETGSTSTSTVAPTISTVTAPSTGLPRNIPGAYITVTGIGFVNGSTTVKVNCSTILMYLFLLLHPFNSRCQSFPQ